MWNDLEMWEMAKIFGKWLDTWDTALVGNGLSI